jgi:hypothetical protein
MNSRIGLKKNYNKTFNRLTNYVIIHFEFLFIVLFGHKAIETLFIKFKYLYNKYYFNFFQIQL